MKIILISILSISLLMNFYTIFQQNEINAHLSYLNELKPLQVIVRVPDPVIAKKTKQVSMAATKLTEVNIPAKSTQVFEYEQKLTDPNELSDEELYNFGQLYLEMEQEIADYIDRVSLGNEDYLLSVDNELEIQDIKNDYEEIMLGLMGEKKFDAFQAFIYDAEEQEDEEVISL